MTDPKHLFRQLADGSHLYPASALYLFTPVTGAAGELIGHHIRADCTTEPQHPAITASHWGQQLAPDSSDDADPS